MKEHFSVCKCHSPEHVVLWTHDKDENEVYFYVNLSWNRSFFKRTWRAIKYIFGYRSMFGHFDCYLMPQEEAIKLVAFLKEYVEENEN